MIDTREITRENLFFCKYNNSFINVMSVCDGKVDCFLATDEQNCSNEINIMYNCPNDNLQINFTEVCDFKEDCSDGSDEKYCG